MAKRRLVKCLLWLALIMVMAAAGAVLLVRSGLLARLALRQASARLDMTIKADGASANLGGVWTFRKISATMAGEEEPFLVAGKLKVRTQPLLGMLKSFRPEVRSVILESPVLALNKDAVEKLKGLGLAGDAEPRVAGRIPSRLPEISISDATVKYSLSPDSVVTVSPINLKINMSGRNSALFDLKLPGSTIVSGELLPDDLQHNIEISIGDGAAIVRGLSGRAVGDFSLQASWNGRIDAGQPRRLTGEVVLKSLVACNVTAAAKASIVADHKKLTARLTSLTIDPSRVLPEGLHDKCGIEAAAGTIVWNYAGNVIDIEALELALLKGSAVANASLYPARLQDTKLDLQYRDIDLEPFLTGPFWRQTSLTGSVVVRPATEKRPPEPLLVVLKADVQGPIAGASDLGTITATAFVGPSRLVTSQARVPIFGGVFSPWLSVTKRGGEMYIHTIADFNDIDLNRLVHFFRPDNQEVPGTLSGTARCSMFGMMRNLSGNADVRIADSDMVNVPVIASVYGGLNLLFRNVDPKGTGRASLSAQADVLQVRSFEYFNRGVDIRGAGTVTKLSAGQEAGITGIVTGSLLPLRGTSLPGSEALGKLMESLQVGFVSVKVGGTLGQATTKVVPLPEVQASVENLLWQQLRR